VSLGPVPHDMGPRYRPVGMVEPGRLSSTHRLLEPNIQVRIPFGSLGSDPAWWFRMTVSERPEPDRPRCVRDA
jgi:hypothetical protein